MSVGVIIVQDETDFATLLAAHARKVDWKVLFLAYAESGKH